MDSVMPDLSAFMNVFWILFAIVFVISAGVLVCVLLSKRKQKRTNDKSPRLTVEARVVSKRMNVSQRHVPVAGDTTGAHGYYTDPLTSYYATFEVESGDRLELGMDGRDYGMLVEGDTGRLSFQGTRYLGFERGTPRSQA